MFGEEIVIFTVRGNQIVDVEGDGPVAEQKREEFRQEVALRNIAEVAVGCNDKAAATGNLLEDEKAGFRWAYGRSDHLGGKVGVSEFSSPGEVYHLDSVYARGSPIVCARSDFVFPDGTRKAATTDGVLCVCPWDQVSAARLWCCWMIRRPGLTLWLRWTCVTIWLPWLSAKG